MDWCCTNCCDVSGHYRVDYFWYVSMISLFKIAIFIFQNRYTCRLHRCWWNCKSGWNGCKWKSISILGVRIWTSIIEWKIGTDNDCQKYSPRFVFQYYSGSICSLYSLESSDWYHIPWRMHVGMHTDSSTKIHVCQRYKGSTKVFWDQIDELPILFTYRVAWINYAMTVVMQILWACVGCLIYAKYSQCDPLKAELILRSDQVGRPMHRSLNIRCLFFLYTVVSFVCYTNIGTISWFHWSFRSLYFECIVKYNFEWSQ